MNRRSDVTGRQGLTQSRLNRCQL